MTKRTPASSECVEIRSERFPVGRKVEVADWSAGIQSMVLSPTSWLTGMTCKGHGEPGGESP